MAVKFDIKDSKLTISASTLSVGAFLAIWEYDKSKSKEKALSLLKHVFHMNDITSDNPMIDIPFTDVERVSKRDCFKNTEYKLTKEEQALFDDASAWYNTVNQRSPWRSLRVVDKKIDQINDHLDKNNITDKNFDDQLKAIERLDKLHLTREKIEELVEKQLKKARTRGGLERSPAEKGLLNIR